MEWVDMEWNEMEWISMEWNYVVSYWTEHTIS